MFDKFLLLYCVAEALKQVGMARIKSGEFFGARQKIVTKENQNDRP